MENQESSIFINQVGYLPEDRKIAFVKTEKPSQFYVFAENSENPVFSGKLQEEKIQPEIDPLVGCKIFTADFSSVKKEGKYYIQIENSDKYSDKDANASGAGKTEKASAKSAEKSFTFEIKSHVYDDLYFSVLNYFKLSRCGQGICHTGKAEVYGTGEIKDVQGGWHDAGDYGRYIVAGTKAVMDLLFAYKKAGAKFDRFDILNEVRFELDWMLQMQREDGALYHKISCYHFCAFINPEDEKDQLVLAPVSTSATADFAGCLAYASTIFAERDADYAKKLLDAALKAQEYLDCHEDEHYRNPPEITTGGYGDCDVSDERYFALCGLFVATGNGDYLKRAVEIRNAKIEASKDEHLKPWEKWHENFFWGMVSGYGSAVLLKLAEEGGVADGGAGVAGAAGKPRLAGLSEATKALFDKTVADLKKAFIAQADRFMGVVNNSAFGLDIMHPGWGSNGSVCDVAYSLLIAYKLTGKEEYLLAAKNQVNYILGCNPLNICYVTGNGKKSPQRPHHRPSGASKKVVPGMLAGGPSAGLQDDYAKQHLQGKPGLYCYADAQPSYSTNEVAIYWNSPFVRLLAEWI